ncbi:uncharacterized protein LOC121387107 [Gigantopelta aegis]|uniref:uncharacterized protein LOC121387107 n=1 Tax=Gigantopelta aegis TaxID=1735272 RepID=UPI001B88BA55|nr:uncharacterized protein LOC121387107 [Gigantopelta aegis]
MAAPMQIQMCYFHNFNWLEMIIMRRLTSNLVVWLLIYICLRNIDGFHTNIYYAEDINKQSFSYTKSIPNVPSKISCAVSCARDPNSCQSWYYNRQEETCRIRTGENNAPVKFDNSDHQGRKQWVLMNPPKVHCRVPFVNNVTSAVDRITKNDGNVPCEPDFCFFETDQTFECRKTGSWTQKCGGCKQTVWRHFTTLSGEQGRSLLSSTETVGAIVVPFVRYAAKRYQNATASNEP